MSALTKFSFYWVLLAILLAFIGFLVGAKSIWDILLAPLLLSLPLLIVFILIYTLDKKGKRLNSSPFYCISYGAFSACAFLHLGFNGIMLIDILQKGSMGPGQAYWILVSVFGSFDAFFYGGLFGGLSFLIYKTFIKYVGNKKHA